MVIWKQLMAPFAILHIGSGNLRCSSKLVINLSTCMVSLIKTTFRKLSCCRTDTF